MDGSANLAIQCVKTVANDLDIDTNDEGIDIFKKVLNKYVIKDFYSEKIKSRSLICKINNFEIEINCYGDRKFDMFDKTKITEWQGLKLPVLPLKVDGFFCLPFWFDKICVLVYDWGIKIEVCFK